MSIPLPINFIPNGTNGVGLPPFPGQFGHNYPLTLGQLDEQVFELNAAGGLSSLLNRDGLVAWERLNTAEDYERLFRICSPLGSIIAQKATAFSNGLFETVNPTTGNYLRGAYKEWDRLWEEPNPLQTRTQWLNQLYMYIAMRGWCYAMPVYAVGFPECPSAIWLLPPWAVEVEPIERNIYTMAKGDAIRKIWLTKTDGTRSEIDESELILFTDNSTILDPATMLPVGRMKLLEYPISTLLASYESRLGVMKERGTRGILSNYGGGDAAGGMPLSPEERLSVERNLKGYGTFGPGQKRVIVTNAGLKWQDMGYDVEEMGLHKEHVSAIKDIAEKYGLPFSLSAHTEHSAEANITTAYETLYTNAIIPEATSIIEQLNRGLNARDKGVKFIVTYEHVSYLQKSQKEKGEGLLAEANAQAALWELGIVTRNDIREALELDTVTGKDVFKEYKFELAPETTDNGTNTNSDTTGTTTDTSE